jgi:hypothetical protein
MCTAILSPDGRIAMNSAVAIGSARMTTWLGKPNGKVSGAKGLLDTEEFLES